MAYVVLRTGRQSISRAASGQSTSRREAAPGRTITSPDRTRGPAHDEINRRRGGGCWRSTGSENAAELGNAGSGNPSAFPKAPVVTLAAGIRPDPGELRRISDDRKVVVEFYLDLAVIIRARALDLTPFCRTHP